jgi:serine/threonine protein kinase
MASALDKQSNVPLRPSLTSPRTAAPAVEAFAMPFEPGEVIVGKYKVIRLIGTGGVGFVVSARHVGFDELVALKFLRPEFATHAEAVTRFTIEARASFKIKSEHVARVLDVDTLLDGTPFIAMELLEGTDLRSVLDRSRMLPIELAVNYVLQTCEALAAAHALHVIHRDIKPENLFLTGPGDETDHIKVLDFGISKVALTGNGRKTNQALTRIAVGTPPYMSPEQVRASSDLDARSDIWSLGCVLYELLTGTAPFDRMSLMQSCAAVLEEQPAPTRDLRPAIPDALDEVVTCCLQKDPDARFQNVAELAEALAPFGSGGLATYSDRCRAFLNGEGLGRRSTPSALPPVPRRPSLPHSLSESSVHRRHTGLPVEYSSGMPARYPTSSRPPQRFPTGHLPPQRFPTGSMPRPPAVMPRHSTESTRASRLPLAAGSHPSHLSTNSGYGSSAQHSTASSNIRYSTGGYSRLPTGVGSAGSPGPLSSEINIANHVASGMSAYGDPVTTRPTLQFDSQALDRPAQLEVPAARAPARWPWALGALGAGAALAFGTSYVLSHHPLQRLAAAHVATAAPLPLPSVQPQPIAAAPSAAPLTAAAPSAAPPNAAAPSAVPTDSAPSPAADVAPDALLSVSVNNEPPAPKPAEPLAAKPKPKASAHPVPAAHKPASNPITAPEEEIDVGF